MYNITNEMHMLRLVWVVPLDIPSPPPPTRTTDRTTWQLGGPLGIRHLHISHNAPYLPINDFFQG